MIRGKTIAAMLFLLSALLVASCSRVEKPSIDDCKSVIGTLTSQAVKDPNNIEIAGIGEYDKKQGWECKAIITELDGKKTGYIFYLKKMVKPTDPDKTPKWRIVGAKFWDQSR